MALKDYSDEFRADAVALYEPTPGATYKSIAADLGINRATLREWVLRDRERRGISAAPASARRAEARTEGAAPSAGPDERVRQLEARVGRARGERTEAGNRAGHPP
ncbi:transposase [Streptomyces violascens]|uniref:transposase n=1 Tax=Streptomyces violascens TaxID=67381 RepID=UPI0037AB53BE